MQQSHFQVKQAVDIGQVRKQVEYQSKLLTLDRLEHSSQPVCIHNYSHNYTVIQIDPK